MNLYTMLSKTSVLLSIGFARSNTHWIPFKETAVALIYQLAEGPEEICAQILQCCSQQALEAFQESKEVDEGELELGIDHCFSCNGIGFRMSGLIGLEKE